MLQEVFAWNSYRQPISIFLKVGEKLCSYFLTAWTAADMWNVRIIHIFYGSWMLAETGQIKNVHR